MKKVGRKAASILLTLCMLLTMLPVSALAVDTASVSTDFTLEGTSDCTGSGWSWVNSTKTLVLTGGTISEAVNDGFNDYFAFILPDGSTIELNSSSTVSCSNADSPYDIRCKGDLTITGNGTLNVEKVSVGGKLTVTGGATVYSYMIDADPVAVDTGADLNAIVTVSELKFDSDVIEIISSSSIYGSITLNTADGNYFSELGAGITLMDDAVLTIPADTNLELVDLQGNGVMKVQQGATVIFPASTTMEAIAAMPMELEPGVTLKIAAGEGTDSTPVYTVTFMNESQVYHTAFSQEGNTIAQPAEPSKEGDAFGGWYKEDTFVTQWDFTADTVTANTTLYAKWEKETVEPAAGVAEIDGKPYPTLEAAIEAAQSGETVKLIENVDLTEVLIIDKSVDLDLNGYTIRQTGSTTMEWCSAFGCPASMCQWNCENSGHVSTQIRDAIHVVGGQGAEVAVNIYDKSEAQTGAVIAGENANFAVAVYGNNLHLKIYGGTYSGGSSFCVFNSYRWNQSWTTLYGGTYKNGVQVNTIRDGTFQAKLGSDETWVCAYDIHDGTYGEGTDAQATEFYGGTFNGKAQCFSRGQIAGGTFNGYLRTWQNVQGLSNCTINGPFEWGSWREDPPPALTNVTFGENASLVHDENYEIIGNLIVKIGSVALIGSQSYETLEAAFAAVEDDQETTITLLKDIAVSAPITIGEAKNVIFNMKGHTITAGEGFSTRVFTNNGTLTITGNGTIDVTAAGANGYGAVNNYGTLTVENGTYKNLKESNASTFYNRNGGTATFGTPTIYGGGGCIGTEVNTTTTINGGYYENETYPAVENRGNMTITAGTFKNTSCSSCDGSKWGYTVRSGESSENAYLKIEGTAADSVKVTGVQGGLAVIGGTADIYNGVYETVACDVHTTGSSAFYAGYFTGESYETAVTIYDGTFQSVSKTAVLVGNDNPPPDSGAGKDSTVMIKGGTFIGGDAEKTAITVDNTDYAKGGASISGGTFSSMPSEEFFAEGFKPEQNEDGTWGVVEDTAIFESGSGTAEDPYIIMNATQLGRFRDSVNSGTNYSKQYIKLGADIDLSGVENWEPIGNSTNKFQGIFDGTKTTDEDGNVTETYIISNLTINRPSQSDVGLFGFTTGGEVKNFTLNNANVTGYLDVGAVAGTPYTSKYTNINVTGTIQVNGFSYVGGAFGKNAYANITDVDVTGDTSSYVKAHSIDNVGTYRTYVGGLVGFMGEGNITVSDCDVKIDVTGSTGDIGGILGILHYGNTLKNCTYVGSLTLTTPNTNVADEFGALVGTVYNGSQNYTTTIANCTATVNKALSGTENVTDTITAHGDFYNSAYGTDKVSIGAKVNGKVVDLYNRDVAKIGDISYNSLVSAVEAAKPGDTITLLGDIDLIPVDIPTENGDVHPHIVINKNLTLDLAGYKIAWDERYHEDTFECTLLIINITDGAEVTITGNGTIDTEAKFNNSYGIELTEGSKLTIENGTFTGATTAVQVTEGKLTILDGTFIQAKTIAQFAPNYAKYVVNAIDANWADGTADISIQGGSFCFDPSDKPENSDRTYVAEGFEAVLNEDGTWGVAEATTYVAEIVGGQKYQSLIDAVEAATAGQTVKLLADVELQPVAGQDYALLIDNGESMTLDLNGHKITATLNNTAGFNLIENYGELTITDNSEGQNGSIEVTENGSAEKARTSILYNGYDTGKLTLEAGTLKLTGGEGSKKPLYGVYSSGTTVVMNGGAIEVRRLNSYSEYSEAWDVYGIYNQGSDSKTTVNGGTITVENQGRYNSAYGIYNASGTVSIHGDPNTPYIEANAFNDGIWYEHTLYGKITLYGGKYNMQTDTATGWIKSDIIIADGYEEQRNGDRTVSIVKSPVAQIGTAKYDTLEEALKEAKSGDTIKLLQNVALTDRVIISKNITLNLNDKTISSTADYTFLVNRNVSFTLENGELKTTNNTGASVFGFTGSTITLASDAKITAANAGILATNNKADEGNATINVYGTIDSGDVAVWGQGPNNTINVDGATITSKYFGVYQNGSFGGTTITIKDSSITDSYSGGAGVYVANSKTNAADPEQGLQKLIIENSQIKGDTAVEVKFTDVIISGENTVLETTNEAEPSFTPNSSGSVSAAYAFAVTHNGKGSRQDAAAGTVTITGGKFTGAFGIQQPNGDQTTSATIAISGGSFSEEPKKDYLAPYYEATQNTTGDGYWTVDVAANAEAIWIKTDATTEAGMLSALLGKADSGTVQLLKNVTTTGYVTVGPNVTLDLAGKTLDTTNSGTFSVFGKVVDSTEGDGLLKLKESSYTIHKDNPSLPIYDSTNGGYRLYTYQLTTLRMYEPGAANTVQFWFKLTFTDEEAWNLLKTGNENHGVKVKSKYQFSDQTASDSWFSFNSEFIHWIADQVVSSQYTQDQLGFYLNVTNTNLLGERTMTVTPAVDTVPSVGTESDPMSYSLNLGE
ncbi:hypothetical protein B5G34_16710 [Flavonifractor sp. An82]|uniref:InlB B-repeat-containing protein n=1 Tax=Flavonifractor sp. An82 TaxID=1965660 RepID=UPI000B38554A|nr:InlB B-repeat-containing protein [Flavonifractor sp. An82]OUN19921.1 hypothetical protein B5G34_16710 [Flavonifractor sp. An82]